MKNIMKVALLSLFCLGAVSCNLDKYPSNALLEEEGFLTFRDAGEFRNGFYNSVRICFGANAVIPVNLQGEGMNATKEYGNNLGPQYLWNFSDSDGTVANVWTNCYLSIFQLNYFIQNANRVLENDSKLEASDENKMTTDQINQMNLYIAEAQFFRAMLNHQLVTFYCKDYEPATAQTDLGIILTDKADIDARSPRSTLEATYKFINDDIQAADSVVNAYYGKDAKTAVDYVSPYAIKCLQAKVYLDTHRYEECAALCEDIVAKYPLTTTLSTFTALWTRDTGSEIIFQFYASPNEGRSILGGVFLDDPYRTGDPLYPKYIPSQWIIDQYDPRDIRKAVYFSQNNIKVGVTTYSLMTFNKYPGNPALNSQAGVNDLANHIRPYRSADFLLMAAESYAQSNNLDAANASLEKLLEARIIGTDKNPYNYEDYNSIDEVMTAIQNERLKEMLMEGNRIADLRRWKKPMSRLGMDSQNDDATLSLGLYLNIPAEDYKFVWPIPQSETNTNPSLQGQQNEGWRNN